MIKVNYFFPDGKKKNLKLLQRLNEQGFDRIISLRTIRDPIRNWQDVNQENTHLVKSTPKEPNPKHLLWQAQNRQMAETQTPKKAKPVQLMGQAQNPKTQEPKSVTLASADPRPAPPHVDPRPPQSPRSHHHLQNLRLCLCYVRAHERRVQAWENLGEHGRNARIKNKRTWHFKRFRD